jgi:hypothetical protein
MSLTRRLLGQILGRIERFGWHPRDHEPHGAKPTEIEWRPAGVSLNGTVGVTTPATVARMTAGDVLGRVDELTAGTDGSVDVVMGVQSIHIGDPD